jgi:hypothetical protein
MGKLAPLRALRRVPEWRRMKSRGVPLQVLNDNYQLLLLNELLGIRMPRGCRGMVLRMGRLGMGRSSPPRTRRARKRRLERFSGGLQLLRRMDKVRIAREYLLVLVTLRMLAGVVGIIKGLQRRGGEGRERQRMMVVRIWERRGVGMRVRGMGRAWRIGSGDERWEWYSSSFSKVGAR